MSGLTRVDYQVRHYRDLAQAAMDRANEGALHRSQYLDLSKQWTALADRLEESARNAFAGTA
jgi:hypothetical protein